MKRTIGRIAALRHPPKLDTASYTSKHTKAGPPIEASPAFCIFAQGALPNTMATQKQIEANRRNAQKSTGPVTELGKGVAKFNALKHGMTASTAVLPHEDASSFAELRESFVATYNPANAVEASLVEVIASSYWRLLRARRAETAAFNLEIRGLKTRNNKSVDARADDDMAVAVVIATSEETLLRIERHQTRIERSYFQAIETLRKVQKERLREERLTTAPPARIGFVSQTAPIPSQTFPAEPRPHTQIIPIGQSSHVGDAERTQK